VKKLTLEEIDRESGPMQASPVSPRSGNTKLN
jgi:hypothetical protein